ncbi:MAG: hypothetical protein ACTSWY_00295 [Promethearchaeota archaeon]
MKAVRISKRVELQIWDIGGEERYRIPLPTYSKGDNGAIILYDITSNSQFNLIVDYVNIIRENAGNIPIILIGNNVKNPENRVVSRKSSINFAESLGMSVFIEIPTENN